MVIVTVDCSAVGRLLRPLVVRWKYNLVAILFHLDYHATARHWNVIVPEDGAEAKVTIMFVASYVNE